MNPQDWVRVGAPLVEQDAEFLRKLIEDAGHPAKLKHLRDIDDGRSVVVLTRRENYPAAKTLRTKHFTDGAEPKRARASRASVGLWPAIASVSGAAIGAPLGWVVRGSALMAGMAGAALALCGLLLALAFSVARASEPTVQQSSAQTSTTVARRNSEGRERKP